MYHLLIYKTADNYLEARAPHRALHLELVEAARRRGEVVLGGALDNPPDTALILFKSSATVAEDFAKNDPYVLNGVVVSWEVRPWNIVIGNP
jgi:uncharacterized protein YciI